MRTLHDGSVALSQRYYARTLKLANKDGTFENFRREIALFSWLSNTRPDVACAENRAAQVTEKTYGPEKVKDLNKAIRTVMKTPDVGLRFDELVKGDMHLRV